MSVIRRDNGATMGTETLLQMTEWASAISSDLENHANDWYLNTEQTDSLLELSEYVSEIGDALRKRAVNAKRISATVAEIRKATAGVLSKADGLKFDQATMELLSLAARVQTHLDIIDNLLKAYIAEGE